MRSFPAVLPNYTQRGHQEVDTKDQRGDLGNREWVTEEM